MSMAFQVYTANEPKDRGLATILPVAHCLDQSDLSPLHFAILKITHVSCGTFVSSQLITVTLILAHCSLYAFSPSSSSYCSAFHTPAHNPHYSTTA